MDNVDLFIRENKDNPAELFSFFLKEQKATKYDNYVRRAKEYREEFENQRLRRIASVGYKKPFEVAVYSETEFEIDPRTKRRRPKILRYETQPSAKIIVPFPQKITEAAVAFLFGGEMSIETENPDEDFAAFKKYVTKKVRMQTTLKKFARTVFCETKSAIVFFIKPKEGNEPAKLKTTILDADSGDFFPYFDEYDDMIAFSRKFETEIDGESGEMVEILTKEMIYRWFNGKNGWTLIKSMANEFKKIPVIYQERKYPIWESVVDSIDKYETRISRLSDTNDYFSEPIVLVFGDPHNIPERGRAGKMLHFEEGQTVDGKKTQGDAKYLTWDSSPDAINLELKLLKDIIFNMTDTPDLSFESLKGLGNVANFAMKLIFLGAEIKKQQNNEDFSVTVERFMSVLVAGYNIIFRKDFSNIEIDVDFASILPDDLKEELDNLGNAVNDGILSKESAVGQNKLVKNASAELERLAKEEQARNTNIADIAGSSD
jgi:SPP1 family phage portal protein